MKNNINKTLILFIAALTLGYAQNNYSVHFDFMSGYAVSSLNSEETNDALRVALVAATAQERNELLCTRLPDRVEELDIEVIGY